MTKLVQVKFDERFLKEIDNYVEKVQEGDSRYKRSHFIREACKDKLRTQEKMREMIIEDWVEQVENWSERNFQEFLLWVTGLAFVKASKDKKFDQNKALKGLNIQELTGSSIESDKDNLNNK